MGYYKKLISLPILFSLLLLSCSKKVDGSPETTAVPSTIELKMARPAAMDPSFMPLGVWYEGLSKIIPTCSSPDEVECARQYYEKSFRDFKDLGVNIVVVPNIRPKLLHVFLQMAKENNIKVVPQVAKVTQMISKGKFDNAKEVISSFIAEFGSYDSLYGYYVVDEPTVGEIEGVNVVKNIFSALDPKRAVYSCLVSHKRAEPFVRSVRLPVQMIDIYPFRAKRYLSGDVAPGDLSKSNWEYGSFGDVIEKYAKLSSDASLWVVIQAFGHHKDYSAKFAWRELKPGEISLQAYEAIANGAKGIFYFIYQSEQHWTGLVREDGTRTEKFEEVAGLNKNLQEASGIITQSDRLVSKMVLPLVKVTLFGSAGVKSALLIHNQDVQKEFCGKFRFDKERPIESATIEKAKAATTQLQSGITGTGSEVSSEFCLGRGAGKFFIF